MVFFQKKRVEGAGRDLTDQQHGRVIWPTNGDTRQIKKPGLNGTAKKFYGEKVLPLGKPWF
jgi:hypothetical protein